MTPAGQSSAQRCEMRAAIPLGPLAPRRGSPLQHSMVDAIARVRFTWDPAKSRCHAAAYDVADRLLGEVTIELPDEVRRRIWATRSNPAHCIEDIAEKNLRAMLELRS